MMLRIICFCIIFVVANAAVASGPLPKKPAEFAHKEGCYVKEVNDVIPFGESVSAPRGKCYQIACSQDSLSYAACGKVSQVGLRPECHFMETDYTRLHPDCCPTINCESDT